MCSTSPFVQKPTPLFSGDKIMLRPRKPLTHYALAAILGLGLTVSLTACKESERDRVLMYKKGTYLGADDQRLNEDVIRALQNRVRYQKMT